MADTLYESSRYFLELFEKITSASIEVRGAQNLVNNPTLFVANHFTRVETFLVPYILFKHHPKKVRAIADDSVFVSYLGKYLNKIGILSVSNPNRDNIIIGDLVTGMNNWLIFPEGQMVKNKKIFENGGRFFVKESSKISKVYTGAAFFALKSQWVKDNFLKLKIAGDTEVLPKIKNKYQILKDEDICDLDTVITPISISYIKIRPQDNFFTGMAKFIFNDMGPRFSEELLVEGSLILNSKIIFNIGKPINVKDYITEVEILSPLNLEYAQKEDLILNKQRYKLAYHFMSEVYNNITIQFDHIFASVLHYYASALIEPEHFKRVIFLTIYKIRELNKYSLDEILNQDLLPLITNEEFEPFLNALNLAITQKVIQKSKYYYKINKKFLNKNFEFHKIRVENILKVYINEISFYKDLMSIIKSISQKNDYIVRNQIVEILKQEDLDLYYKDRKKYEGDERLKDENIAKPYFLDLTQHKRGIVLSHGFGSSPKEVESLASFLNSIGFIVYLPRLKGHGLVSEELKDIKWQEWYESFNRGYAIVSLMCEQVYVAGFSTGGLLALVSASRKSKKVDGIISINAALKLNDIRIKYILPAISFWNELLTSFHSNTYTKEYINNKAENPDLNYDQHYVKSIEQLSFLMNYCEENLEKITQPILIIQGDQDPVVNPQSAEEIYENIKSKIKKLAMMQYSRHVILKGENIENIFEEIEKFLVE